MGSISRTRQCDRFIAAFNALFKREYSHLVGTTLLVKNIELCQADSDDSLVVVELTLENQNIKTASGNPEVIQVPLFAPFAADCDDPDDVEECIDNLEVASESARSIALGYYNALEEANAGEPIVLTDTHLWGEEPLPEIPNDGS
jgi:hypothetical protein